MRACRGMFQTMPELEGEEKPKIMGVPLYGRGRPPLCLQLNRWRLRAMRPAGRTNKNEASH